MKIIKQAQVEKIQITPKTIFGLNMTQKSLLDHVARRVELKKEDVIDKVISAGLRAIIENNCTLPCPLKLHVEKGFNKSEKKVANKATQEERKSLSHEHLKICFENQTNCSKSELVKKLKEITGTGESTCYRVISRGGYLSRFLKDIGGGRVELNPEVDI